ncbi:replication initiation protein [Caballeronia sp. LZ032]|uniref:replication initiation protein n=1 Tax=Caballeronia sp. LZ032 TaxID=3038565 RepID=UPI00286CB016|nr:replication initiation protein [Caballeronia sp. LZ032]
MRHIVPTIHTRKRLPKTLNILAERQALPLELRKHVGTVHVGGALGLLDRKLVNVLLANAYDNLLKEQVHRIPVALLSEMLGFDSKNTAALKKSLKQIATTPVEFDLLNAVDDSPWGVTTMLSAADIRDGICTYEYSRALSERLANPDVYLIVNVGMQKRFNGKFGLALWENCLRFKKTGSTGWIPVEVWRKLLNAEAGVYDTFKHFNRDVIGRAVSEVNTVSNILVQPEYQRESRRVAKIRFLVEENPQKSMYDNADSEDVQRLKESELYARLRALNIADRLAVAWLQEDQDKVARAVDYVERQVRNKRNIKNAGGYMRAVWESGNDVTDVDVSKREQLPTAQTQAGPTQEDPAIELKVFRRRELDALVTSYAESGGGVSSYSSGRFRAIKEKLMFGQWLFDQHSITRWKLEEGEPSAS